MQIWLVLVDTFQTCYFFLIYKAMNLPKTGVDKLSRKKEYKSECYQPIHRTKVENKSRNLMKENIKK